MHPCPLQSIELKNFKSIAHGAVEFNPLTVLVGMNSSGKSSLLQAIRFLFQTSQNHNAGARVPLNDTNVRLGTFGDVHTVGTTGQLSFLASIAPKIGSDLSAAEGDSPSRLRLTLEEPPDNSDRGYALIATDHIDITDAAILFCAQMWLDAIWKTIEDTWSYLWHPEMEYPDIVPYDKCQILLDELQRVRDQGQTDGIQDGSLILVGADEIRRAFRSRNLRTFREFMADIFLPISTVEDRDSRDAIANFVISEMWSPPSDESTAELPDNISREVLAKLFGRELATLILELTHKPLDLDSNMSELRAFYRTQDAQLGKSPESPITTDTLDESAVERVIHILHDRTRGYSAAEVAAIGLSMIEVGGLDFDPDPKMGYENPDDENPAAWPVTDTHRVAELFVEECTSDEWGQGSSTDACSEPGAS